MLNSLGLYVHVPFCPTSCPFCSFYQEKPTKELIASYTNTAKRETQAYFSKKANIDTFFWGGGTPGVLTAEYIEDLGRHILSFCTHTPVEWTVEMAPSTVKSDKLKALKSLGVTRISLGVQSFQPHLLNALRKSQKQVLQAYECIREAGFPQVNIDLMFSLPEQSLNDWENDLLMAASLNPDHISTYSLTIEPNTLLQKQLAKNWRTEERELAFYELTWKMLPELGFQQYEISNFAKPNCQCLHNVNTWKMQDWIGIGPSAASQFNHQRYANPKSLTKWTENVEILNTQGKTIGQVVDPECLALIDQQLAIDCLIFGLRMNAGIHLPSLQKRFPEVPFHNLASLWSSLTSEGLADICNDSLQLTHKGRLLADSIGLLILENENLFSRDPDA